MSGKKSPFLGPVIVDVRAVQVRQIAVGSVVAGGIGLIAVVSALTGDVEGGTGTRVAAFAIGLVFCLIGCLPLLLWRIAFRPRRLVLDSTGLRWEDPDGAPWAVGWADLAEVRLDYPAPEAGGPRSTASVSLRLRPADPSFRAAHPEMEHLAGEEGGYRVPMGHAMSLVGPIDRAVSRYAPGIYRRVGPDIPEPRDRPRAVRLAVAILGFYWATLMVITLVVDGAEPWTLGMVLLWTSVAALWLGRVWAGGAAAVGRMAFLAKALGVLGLVTIGLLGLFTLPMLGELGTRILVGFLPGLATTAALLVSGRLLSREDVRDWAASRAWGL